MADDVFYRESEPEMEISIDIKRYGHATFNEFTAYIRDGYFGKKREIGELLDFAIDVSRLIHPNHGFIAHKKQKARQSPTLTLNERLPGIYWANFFGPPYLKFFGLERLLNTPCYKVRELDPELIVLLTALCPYSSEILFDDSVPNAVKDYLGRRAFAGPKFPHEDCVVPAFDFSDVRIGSEDANEESKRTSLSKLRDQVESMGYQLVSSTDSLLTFRGRDGSIVLIDVVKGSVTLDVSRR